MDITRYFDEILNLLKEGVIITDRFGNHRYVNRTYEEFSEVDRAMMLGKTAAQMHDQGYFDVILNPEVVRTGKPATRVQTLKNGRKVVLNAYPVFDKAGDVALVTTFIRDVTSLTNLRQQLESQQELLSAFQKLHSSGAGERLQPSIVMNSGSMHAFFAKLVMAADSEATILLRGETGTGKDIFARKAAAYSPRSDKIFIKLDCSSIPENLIETELFGYMPGTFSGASAKGKIGLIEAANSGTVFLDEIGELPVQMQSRLLRVLQDREIVRVGAVSPTPVDVRFIVATNKNLEDEVAAGRFRNDLYYRLTVSVFHIPPLRERKEDIVPMALSFLEKYANKYHRTLSLSSEAKHFLENYAWPGNVRQLENLIHGLAVSKDRRSVVPEDLGCLIAENGAARAFTEVRKRPAQTRSLKEAMDEYEEKLLREEMVACASMAELCHRLGIDRTTVIRKLRKHGIPNSLKKQ